ncbi:alginate lyase family protein [Candidatus Saccharibacteria bacterium]|nr:alginate lyase family protein [Candidatus Saccharibacteria bacterium]
MRKKYRQLKSFFSKKEVIIILIITFLGVLLAFSTKAATPFISIEVESGTKQGVQPINDSSASNNQYIQFGSGSPNSSTNAGVFITKAELNRAKSRQGTADPYGASYSLQTSLANDYLSRSPNVFYMTESDYLNNLSYSWCGQDTDNIDNSLKNASDKLENDGSYTRVLAMQYALTSDSKYGSKAAEFLKAWANNSRVINMYDFDMNTAGSASLRGMTDGLCSFRPWNFALDSMWQGYGLINFSDSYVLLKNNGYQFSSADDQAIKAYLLRLAEAVNSSYHAWTKWADNHTSSSSYIRYRADNHLSWAQAMLLSAAVALDDQNLANYCLNGGTWYDSKAGNYTNPSPIKTLLDKAILADGRIIDPVEFDRPEQYTYFHLWPMQLSSLIAERHYGENLWEYKGSDGASLQKAYTTAVNNVVSGGYSNEAWQFEVPYNKWGGSSLKSARDSTNRLQVIKQSIGPVVLLFGEN